MEQRGIDKNTVKDIIKTRADIRRKFKALRGDTLQTTEALEKVFTPITLPLKEILGTSKSLKDSVQHIDNKEEPDESSISQLKKPMFSSTPKTAKTNIKSSPLSLNITSQSKSRKSQGEQRKKNNSIDNLQRSVLKSMGHSITDLDTTFGPYFNELEGKWYIGDTEYSLNKNQITINKKTFILTPGLKELIFLKKPDTLVCDRNDYKNYQEILLETNLKNKLSSNSKPGSTAKIRVIKQLITGQTRDQLRKKSGSGLMKLSRKPVDYVYWDDANELIERLRLLLASQHAGNTSHANEIISIIEELKEADIIV